MRDNLAGALWRLGILAVVCALGTFGLFMVFAQLRFQAETDYNAEFTNVSGLKTGDFVRIATTMAIATVYVDRDVRPGTTYRYAVTALDRARRPNESPRSNEISVRVP